MPRPSARRTHRPWSTSITIETGRALSLAEQQLAASVFGDAIDYGRVKINRRRWWPLQRRNICMAPDGHLWFHPRSPLWCEDFAGADIGLKGLFIHEMTHVWQSQTRGRWYLPLMRHPFCRYDYALKPGKRFNLYGLEQQAEIARHAFLLRNGVCLKNKPALPQYDAVLPFNA